MPSGIITLTTDFGLSDHYVGVMKGVIASIYPDSNVIDICHEVSSYRVEEGAFTVSQSYPFFPKETVHVVVVDPGVGTERRPLVVHAGNHYFVAPDNGVLSQVYEREFHRVRGIDVDRYALKPTSHTFHGRDVFAPVAARLAMGHPFAKFGETVTDYVQLPSTKPEAVGSKRWRGKVLNIDQFGNVVTSFPAELLPEQRSQFLLVVGRLEVKSYADAYGLAGNNEPFAIIGSSGYVELSLVQKSAADLAKAKVGDSVELILD